jgi:hypothetical protein
MGRDPENSGHENHRGGHEARNMGFFANFASFVRFAMNP